MTLSIDLYISCCWVCILKLFSLCLSRNIMGGGTLFLSCCFHPFCAAFFWIIKCPSLLIMFEATHQCCVLQSLISCFGIHRRSPLRQLHGGINVKALQKEEKCLWNRCGQLSCFCITEPLYDTSADVIPQLHNPTLHLQMGHFGVFIQRGNEELSHRIAW